MWVRLQRGTPASDLVHLLRPQPTCRGLPQAQLAPLLVCTGAATNSSICAKRIDGCRTSVDRHPRQMAGLIWNAGQVVRLSSGDAGNVAKQIRRVYGKYP